MAGMFTEFNSTLGANDSSHFYQSLLLNLSEQNDKHRMIITATRNISYVSAATIKFLLRGMKIFFTPFCLL